MCVRSNSLVNLENYVMRHSYSVVRAAILAAATLLAASPAFADGLSGSWSGSGSVMLPSGNTEKARCKVSFRKEGGKNYGMNAVCASSSARVAQTANLEQVGPNRYAGDFTNQEYGVTGSIVLTVSGSSLSASMQGGGGSASFNLSR
jgi:hypothetical protein